MRNEPVLTAQSITALISAGMVALVALGVIDLDDTQQAAIMAFAIAAVNVIAGVIARSWVTPVANPKARIEDGSLVNLVRADNGQPPVLTVRKETPQ